MADVSCSADAGDARRDEYAFPVIGVVRSCYKAKFGVPRQPGLIREATGYIELVAPYNQPNAVRGLEGFSHIWVLFVFHQNLRDAWKATVRPPRLGGDKRVGVFATRSPFRPSPVGLSVVELTRIEIREHGVIRLHVRGVDVVDGTPVVDIKPYVPYTDSIPDARASFAQCAPEENAVTVVVSEHAQAKFDLLAHYGRAGLAELARRVVAADPRPAYQKEDGRIYGVFLEDVEIVWRMDGETAVITDVLEAKRKRGGDD